MMTKQASQLFVVVACAFALTACNKQEVSVTGPSPVSSTGGVVVIEVSVSTPNLTISLNACPATIGFAAVVRGTNVTQTVTWSSMGEGNFSPSGTSATLVVNTAGTYIVTATSTQNANISGTVAVIATGNCGPSSSRPGSFSLSLDGCTAVSSNENRARFNWTPSSRATNYRVERRVWSTGSWVSQGTSDDLMFQQTVANNADYYYRVVAVGSGGETLSTPEELFVCGMTPQPPPPTPTPPNIRTITLAPAGASGQAGTTFQTTATCRIDGVVVSCSPWWYSSDPSRVSVNPITGLLQYVWTGSATICVQWSPMETDPRACHVFTTQ